MQGLTKRQRMVLDFISHNITQKGYPPTLREIGAFMGIRSTNGVNDHLRALERKGYLKREDMKSRALIPIASAHPAEAVEVPIVGRITAGLPILADENIEEIIRVDRFFVGENDGVFALRVKGDRMIHAGILDGDYALVRPQSLAGANDIVVVPMGDEATPADASMVPIVARRDETSHVRILGVVIGVFRRL